MSWSICTSERFGDSFYVLRAWVSVSSLVNVGVKVAMDWRRSWNMSGLASIRLIMHIVACLGVQSPSAYKNGMYEEV